MDIKKKKKELRKQIVRRRDQLTREEIMEKSRLVAENLYKLSAYRNAKAVMFFISFGSEVDTRLMVEETITRGKIALAPKTLPASSELLPSQIMDWDNDLAPGYHNIPEPREETLRPHDPEIIDLLIVPGVAFDHKKCRLGYGGGFYDRFFYRLKPGTPLVALCFELQILPEIPADNWDRRVDIIVTEKRIINQITAADE